MLGPRAGQEEKTKAAGEKNRKKTIGYFLSSFFLLNAGNIPLRDS